eukprot:m.46321 g.46321  ORF g.46321 m.46321 type:complete len:151 (+) comp8741_c1_seq1:908-1360(+)
MAGRIIAQMVAMGVQVGVRVFAQVYQEVANNAKRGGTAGAKQAANEGAKAVRSKLSHQMPLDEAYKVLDVPTSASAEEIVAKYDHLFHATDRKNGGNLYLQSKVYRAREAIDTHEAEKMAAIKPDPAAEAKAPPPPETPPGPSSKGDDPK